MINEQFTSTAVLKAKEGKRTALKEALLELINPTRSEPGCLYYILFEDKNHEGTFYMHEAFRDKAAFDFHIETVHFKNFAVQMDELMSEPIQLIELVKIL
ncbi:putative quinol monooxygenase [Chryseobacterium carnipullorum]|uniref:Monooxygenase ycnE n=1 Tax=Chryseobacterium carnipullorum TaxID=1124835 RepID=A0A1M7MKJ4_CHRCU|nr:putative quinol monooxygenase [Chryseobacterium carnipullorum]MDN5479752.1 antibiotic biosynthesis monooxygenase [Chryseobacterium sp.]SHM91383.1 Quinol monooxygenase YgiN [Chryseobacterium carnipullorum]STD00169.1 Putative monooxygenase ycnE [Chryseobacterium carnipullorum]